MIEEKLSALIVAIQDNTKAVSALAAMQIPATLESTTVAAGNKSVTKTTIQTGADMSGIPVAPGTVELDKKGYPWDARIHAKDKSQLQSGCWKQLRQLTSKFPNKDDWTRYVESIKAEILNNVQTNQVATGNAGAPLHAEANQAAEEALAQGQAPAAPNQQPGQANIDPRLIGRVINGVAIPEGVVLGMENEWLAFQPGMQQQPPATADTTAQLQNQAAANAALNNQAQLDAAAGQPGMQAPINGLTGLPYTIDDVRAAMMMYQATKGATAIVETLSTFAPTLEGVPPEQYGNLIGAMMMRPDLAPAMHPAQH